jgi:DNA-3-methyladenine glycosylase II
MNQMTFTETFNVLALAPFNFDLTARIFGSGDRQIRIYEDGRFWQVTRVGGKLAFVMLESAGTVEAPRLRAELKATQEISRADTEEVARIVTRLFNLDLDLLPFYAVAKNDETLLKITQRLWGLRSPTTQTVYEALMDSIVEQQISLKVATIMERRMIKKFGEALTVEGDVYYAYPVPKALADAEIDELRGCGLSGRKAEYVKGISSAVTAGKLDLEKFRSYGSAEDIVRELDAVRGIGTWTAELTVIRALQKWDAMPADDVGLRRIISQYYCGGRRISSEEAKKIAETWGKWRGLAAFYFVVADLVKAEV